MVGTVRARAETCSFRDAHRLPSGVQPLEQMETSHPEIQRERELAASHSRELPVTKSLQTGQV